MRDEYEKVLSAGCPPEARFAVAKWVPRERGGCWLSAISFQPKAEGADYAWGEVMSAVCCELLTAYC